MKTTLLRAALVAALPSVSLASPTILTDQEMARISAGSTVSLSVAGIGVVNVSVDGNSLQITGDAAALKMTTVVVNGMAIDLQGKPLNVAIPASASVNLNVNSQAASTGQIPSGVSVNVSTMNQPSSTVVTSSSVSGSSTVMSNVTSTSNVHLTTSSSVMINR